MVPRTLLVLGALETGVFHMGDPEKTETLPYARLLGLGYRFVPFLTEQALYVRERLLARRIGRHQWHKVAAAPPVDRTPPTSSEPPAILIGMHWLEHGGAERLGFQSIEIAVSLGLRVFVVTERNVGQHLASKLPEGVVLLDLAHVARSEWPTRLTALVRTENIRAIHIHHCVPLYASLAVLRRETPWVRVYDSLHIHEHYDGGYVRISGVWSPFIDATHVISRDLMTRYRTAFECDPVLGRMISGLPKPMTLSKEPQRLRVGFVGRMTYQKRPVTVVWAMVRLARWARRNQVEISFDMVGEGPFLRFARQIAKRKSLSVVFHSENADVPALMEEWDVLLLPSSNEGLALVAAEAIENGVFPLATDVGAMKELLPPDLLTHPLPSATVSRMVRIVDRLWHDPAFAAKQADLLSEKLAALTAEPSAKQVIEGFYRQVI